MHYTILVQLGRNPKLFRKRVASYSRKSGGVRDRMGPRKGVLNGSGRGRNEAAAVRKCREEWSENNVLTPSGVDLTIA